MVSPGVHRTELTHSRHSFHISARCANPPAFKSPQSAGTANGNLLVTQKLHAAQLVLGLLLSKMFQPELQMKRRIWVELSLVFLNLDLLRITQNSPRSRNKNKDREGP